MRPTLLALALLLVPVPFVAAEEAASPESRPHTDEQVAPVLAQFEKDFAAKDMDSRLKALKSLGLWRHKKVLKILTRTFEKDADLELKAMAAAGLGRQTSFVRQAGQTLAKALDEWKKWATRIDPLGDDAIRNEDEARVLIAAIRGLGDLRYKDSWDAIEVFVDHPHDLVAGEMMTTCGKLKEYRALPLMLEWFNFYPDGLSWSGGSTSVDTGSAGNEDQKAAEAKWKRTFGSRKKKARPATFELMVAALKEITGVEFKKPAELKQWMEDNKLLLKKHGV